MNLDLFSSIGRFLVSALLYTTFRMVCIILLELCCKVGDEIQVTLEFFRIDEDRQDVSNKQR